MTRTKYQGVYYRDNQHNDRVFYIQYKDLNGKLIRKKIGTKSEGISPIYCKKLRDQILVKLRLGEDAPVQSKSSAKTLKEVSDEYFEDSEARSKNKLQSVYSTHLSFLDNEPITAIDKDVIEKLKSSKAKEISPKTKRILSPKTVNNILALLSAILNWAEEERDYIKSVPKFKKYSINNSRERFLSKDEINTLYGSIENSGLPTTQRLLLFTKISLFTGARLGSVITIKGKDINRTNKTITLQNHKTNGTYTAFVPTDLMDSIPPLKPLEKLIDVSDPKQIQRPLQGILDKLFNVGLNADDRKDRVVVHSLRHTFASHLAINGTPIHKIMRLMDHSDISMTIRYAKLMPDSGRSEVENLYG